MPPWAPLLSLPPPPDPSPHPPMWPSHDSMLGPPSACCHAPHHPGSALLPHAFSFPEWTRVSKSQCCHLLQEAFSGEMPSLTKAWAGLGVPPLVLGFPVPSLDTPWAPPVCLQVIPAMAGAAGSEQVHAAALPQLSRLSCSSPCACQTSSRGMPAEVGQAQTWRGEGVHTPRGDS